MVDYYSRAAWGARPATGSTSLDAGEVDGIAVHWPGTTDEHDTAAQVAEALRDWQAYHMDGKGWSDIAYQVAVDMAGRAWILRGLATRSAANGDADVNRRYGALLLVLSTSQTPSEAMLATAREVIRDFRELYSDGVLIRPHSAVRPEPTECPGDPVRAAIGRGDLTPITRPPTGDDFMATLTDAEKDTMLAALSKSATASAEVAQILRTHAVRMDNLVNDQLPKLRVAIAALLQVAVDEDVDTDQMRALLAEIRDDTDRAADSISGSD